MPTSVNRIIPFNRRLSGYISLIALSVWLVGMFFWLNHDPTADLFIYKPGMDNQPAGLISGPVDEKVMIGEYWQRYDSSSVAPSGNWQRFRGGDFTNIVPTVMSLSNLQSTEPSIKWSIQLGEGHAGASVYNGHVYILDYDEVEKTDALRCFALEDGRELWRRSYAVQVKRNHGMSRTVPAVTEDFILTIGPRCHVMCVETTTGNLLWELDLEREYGTEVPLWYTGQCPLIDDSVAILATGGKALLIGIDCQTGEILWETPNPGNWQMSHSSIIPMTLHGKRQYVYSAVGGIAGISAEKEDMGKLLWEYRLWNHAVTAPSPLEINDNRIFLTAGYGAGGMLVQINLNQGQYSVDSLQFVPPGQGCAAEQQTPILYNNRIWTILPKDGGALKEQFTCYDSQDISKVIWSSGKTKRFGLGPFILADSKFYVLDDMGVLSVFDELDRQPVLSSEHKILTGSDAWAPIAIVDGLLLARDSHQMVCVDISTDQLSGRMQ
jgi:outer membrane protein assembly factor BamB